MEKAIAFIKRPVILIGIAVVVALILGGAAGGLYFTQTSPPQPINFPHQTHVGIGAPCLYCHPAAAWGPTAGLPSQSKCWGCHQQVQKKSPELDKLAKYVQDKKPIPWVPVFTQPEFVHFNHRPHVAAGVACETCHGDMTKIRVARSIKGQNMGWCLNCHKKMAPEKYVKLSDCGTCHY